MRNILQYYRVNDWWNFIIPPIIAFYFIGLLSSNSMISFLWIDFLQFFLFIILTIHTAMFGFALGEISDINDDQNAGKNNTLFKINKNRRWLILIYPIIVIIISLIFIRFTLYQYILFFLQIFFLVIYSIKPFRLKRKKFLAVLLDALYSGTIFYVLALMMNTNNRKLIVSVLIWGILRGIRNILNHLIKDRENDILVKIETIATAYPIDVIKRYLFNYLIPLEYISINIMLYFFPYNIWYMIIYNIYMLYTLERKTYIIPFILKRKEKIQIDYISGINRFFESVLIIISLVFFVMQDVKYILIFSFVFILFPRILMSWVGK